MNGTTLRSILVVATCLNTALLATDVAQFHNPTVDTIYRVVSLILNFIIVALATYFNNDYTKEARISTGKLRLIKAQKAGKIDGENFFDEAEAEHDDIQTV